MHRLPAVTCRVTRQTDGPAGLRLRRLAGLTGLIGRAGFLGFLGFLGLLGAFGFGSPISLQGQTQLVVDRETRTLRFSAEARPSAFEASLPPDHQYHALVFKDGGAADRSLFVTQVPDTEIARALRALGAQDGGGVPLSAWNLRWVPLVPQPASRVQGSKVEIFVSWDGQAALPFDSLLSDPGRKGIEMRFGGNEEHDDHWGSGCIVCLYSCPGGVISNASYTIRDHQRGVTHFTPNHRMPPDGTAVTIEIRLLERGPP
jgi:hypothetical protein